MLSWDNTWATCTPKVSTLVPLWESAQSPGQGSTGGRTLFLGASTQGGSKCISMFLWNNWLKYKEEGKENHEKRTPLAGQRTELQGLSDVIMLAQFIWHQHPQFKQVGLQTHRVFNMRLSYESRTVIWISHTHTHTLCYPSCVCIDEAHQHEPSNFSLPVERWWPGLLVC